MADYSTLYPDVVRLLNLLAAHMTLADRVDIDDKEAAAALEPAIANALNDVRSFAEAALLPADQIRFDMRPDRR